MVSYYDELEIEDFAWDDVKKVFHYPCPCGDRFEISRAQLAKGDEVATCPSCSLLVRVVYDMMDYEDYESDEEEETAAQSEPIPVL
ncbi:CSL-type zinc finger protein [Rhodotorula paludigena]|uniref:CSL-type zinc finger protein n=1 Tax=Rhodotorula paludigena TaxID=86838 RepID=UPI003173FD5D